MQTIAKIALAAPVVAATILLAVRYWPEDHTPEAAVAAASSDPVHTSADATTGIVGRASVIDGDTLEIGGVRVRLHGVDAPESSQNCVANGATYRCGQRAALALSDLIGVQTVRCEQLDTDRYGRAVARCLAGGQDVAEVLVAEGFAVAYRQYSRDYVAAEGRAQRERKGLWAGDFVPPDQYRRQRRGGT